MTILLSLVMAIAGGGITGTICGWVIGFSGLKSVLCCVVIGVGSGGLAALYGGRTSMLTGAVGSIFGYFWGQFLDINFRFEKIIADRIMETHPGISREAAEQIADVQHQGATPWVLFRNRMDVTDFAWVILSMAVAVASAYVMMNYLRRRSDAE